METGKTRGLHRVILKYMGDLGICNSNKGELHEKNMQRAMEAGFKSRSWVCESRTSYWGSGIKDISGSQG